MTDGDLRLDTVRVVPAFPHAITCFPERAAAEVHGTILHVLCTRVEQALTQGS